MSTTAAAQDQKALVDFGSSLRDPSLSELEAAPDALHQYINFFMSRPYPLLPVKAEDIFPKNQEWDSGNKGLQKAQRKYKDLLQRLKKKQAQKKKPLKKAEKSRKDKFKYQLDFKKIMREVTKQESDLVGGRLAGAFLVSFFKQQPEQLMSASTWTNVAETWRSEQPRETKVTSLRAALQQEQPLVRHTIGHLLQLFRLLEWRRHSDRSQLSYCRSFRDAVGDAFVGELREEASGCDENFLSFAIANADDVFRDPETGQCYHRCYDCLYTHAFDRILSRTRWYEGRDVPAVLEQLTKLLAARQLTVQELESAADAAELDEAEERICRRFPTDVELGIGEVGRDQQVKVAVGLLKRFLLRLRDSGQLIDMEDIRNFSTRQLDMRPLFEKRPTLAIRPLVRLLRNVDGFLNLEPKRAMDAIGSFLVFAGRCDMSSKGSKGSKVDRKTQDKNTLAAGKVILEIVNDPELVDRIRPISENTSRIFF